jgi:hypothetical protein
MYSLTRTPVESEERKNPAAGLGWRRDSGNRSQNRYIARAVSNDGENSSPRKNALANPFSFYPLLAKRFLAHGRLAETRENQELNPARVAVVQALATRVLATPLAVENA